eukprot:403351936
MKNQWNINQEVVNDQKTSQPQAFVFFPGWSITNGACGPTSYSITANGGPAVAPYFSIIGPPTRNIYYWSDRISDVGVKTIRLTGVSTHGGNTAHTEFTITYLNPCPSIAPIYPSTLGPQIYKINCPAVYIQFPAFTYNSNGVDCGTLSYQLYNEAHGASDLVFTLIQANRTIKVYGSDAYLLTTPFANYKLIIRGFMSSGLHTEYAVIFQFAIDCDYDRVIPQSDITETYFINDPHKIIPNTFTTFFGSHCNGVISYSCKFLNNSDCSTSSSILFDTANANLKIYGYTNSGKFGYRTLTINIESICRTAVITSQPIGFVGQYDIMNSTLNLHQVFNVAWTSDKPTCTFSFSFLDVDTGLLISPSIFSNDASQNLLLHTSKLVPPKFYTINVTGCLHPLVCDTQQMTINITDLCATAVISTDTPPDTVYTTSDPSQLLSFSQWTSTPAFCIYYDYVLTLDDNITVPTFAILNNATRQITIYTTDKYQVGNRNATLKGTLTQNNHAVAYFMVEIIASPDQNLDVQDPCESIQVKKQSLKDITYTIGQDQLAFIFPKWVTQNYQCNQFEYSLRVSKEQFKEIIVFDPIKREVSIQTSDQSIGNQTVLVTVVGKSFYGQFTENFNINFITPTGLANNSSNIVIINGTSIDKKKVKQTMTAIITDISNYGKDYDYLQIKVKQPLFFVAKTLDQSLTQNYEMKKEIPPQYYNSTQMAFLKQIGEVAGNAITGTITSNIALSIILGFSLKNLWMLMNTLQIIVNIPLLSLNLPQNIVILCKQLIDIANLNLLPKEYVNKLLSFMFIQTGDQIEDTSTNLKQMDIFQKDSEFSSSIQNNIGTLFVVLIMLLLASAVALILHLLNKKFQFLKKVYDWLKVKLFYNSFLRSIMKGYLNYIITFTLSLKYSSGGVPEQIVSVVALIFLISLPFTTKQFLSNNQAKLNDFDFQNKYSALYLNIKREEGLYIFLFFFRRLCYVLVINFAGAAPFIQVSLMNILSIVMISYLLYYKPLDSKNQMIFEIYNEMTILL